MHASVMTWVAAKVVQHDLTTLSTLELGSYDVNGTVRNLFNGSYLGLDIREGPCVDLVGDASCLPFDDDSFELVVSCEMLEHCEHAVEAVCEATRVVSPGGLVIITARGPGFPPHDYPHDYWRFRLEDVEAICFTAGLEIVELISDTDPDAPGFFLVGRKP